MTVRPLAHPLPELPEPPEPLDRALSSVVIVSGSYGAGHDAAAAELATRLGAAGIDVRRLDVAAELPLRIGALLRAAYFTQLRFAPSTWGATLGCLEHGGRLSRAISAVFGLLGRRLVRRARDADLIISTHPFASQALGHARGRGRLAAPVVTYLTDASVHRLWVHPGVDLHLAMHEVTARQARALGATTTVVEPVVSPPVSRATSLAVATGDWCPGWAAGRPYALVVGGSCGVGQLEEAAHDIAATGLLLPVVACGRNERLRHRLAQRPGVVALGWRDDLPEIVARAACTIQNAGGITSLESLSAGTPTLTYRPLPGHGTTNAAALDEAGLVPWLRGADDLDAALAGILGRPARDPGEVLPTGAREVVSVLTSAFDLAPRERVLDLVGAA